MNLRLSLLLLLMALLISSPAAANAEGSAGAAHTAEDEPIDMAAALAHAPPMPRAAILRYASTDLEQWHYLRTRVSEDGVMIDRHDPTLPGEEHWQLVSIDGREPTDRERRKYERDRADHSDSEERARGEELAQVLAPGSFVFLGEESGDRRYRYALRSPDGKREAVWAGLEGDLLVAPDPEAPWVREARVWNRDTLRPGFGVRIDEARLTFTFRLQEGWVLPDTVEARWAGEFLGLRSLGDTLSFRLEDFRHIGTPKDREEDPQAASTGP